VAELLPLLMLHFGNDWEPGNWKFGGLFHNMLAYSTICQHIPQYAGMSVSFSQLIVLTETPGVFCLAKDERGDYLVNRWGEQKFTCLDGLHRCVVMVSISF
jgi:hypothetical protein